MRTGRHGRITHHINANKQFKRDSQRLAFLLLLQITCLWHNALGFGGSVAHPLIGRYTLYEESLKIQVKNCSFQR